MFVKGKPSQKTKAAALVLAGTVMLGTGFLAKQMNKPQVVPVMVTVESGDTLWSIAEENCPSRDPREVVWEIEQANQIGAYIRPGDRLKVPRELRQASRGNRTLVVEATGYTWTGNRTASGTWPEPGTIAVDPEVIPLGSRVRIGDRLYIAEDTGRDITGARVDIYFPTQEAALEFGRQEVEVEILD